MLIVLNLVFLTTGEISHKPAAAAAPSQISVRTLPTYSIMRKNLQRLVQEKASNVVNHFYVSKFPAGGHHVYVFWKEQRQFRIMFLGVDEDSWEWSMQRPRGATCLDLDADVVGTAEQIGSSTYLVEQAWINERLFDAAINGDVIVVRRLPVEPARAVNGTDSP